MNPLHETLKQVLPTRKHQIFDYSIDADFARLWKFDKLPEDQILIVWSGTALDPALAPINAADCLSPVDWAIAYASQRKDESAKWPDVLIFDVQPHLHSRVPTLAHLQLLRPDLFPWLRVETFASLSTLLHWLQHRAPRPKAACEEALQQLLRDIRLNLTEVKTSGSYDRHAIANIIGPMVLRRGKAKDSPHSAALRSLLSAIGLIAPPTPASGDAVGEGLAGTGPIILQAENLSKDDGPQSIARGPSDNLQTPASATEDGKGLHIVLVDDQAKHGWEDWVKDCLPAASVLVVTNQPPEVVAESGSLPAAPVSSETDLVSLVKEVEKQLDQAKTKDLRFRLKLPGTDESKQPVLLLDLRLFSGKPDAEVAFYKDTLLPLVNRFTDRPDLAWPAFSTKDQKLNDAIMAVTEKKLKLESPEHHEALTWLPRVLALADMSLPIVLFSSTGRRMLTKRFAGYDNIITAFEKPKLGDIEVIQRPLGVASGFRDQITLARRWIQPRAWLSLAWNPPTDKTPSQQAGQPYKAVIYLDETGSSPNLKFISLVALYTRSPSEEDCEKTLTSDFDAHVRAFDGKDWLRINAGTVLGKIPAGANGPKLALVHLTADESCFFHTSLAKDDELHDENVGDNLWRQLFRQTVEASIYVVARSLLSPGDRIETFSVRAPTRTQRADPHLEAAVWNRWGVPCESVGPEARLFEAVQYLSKKCTDDPSFPAPWRELIDMPRLLQDMRPNTPDRMLRYFNLDSPRPIVEDIMKRYRDSSFCPTADLVRAFLLNSHKTGMAKHTPILHFLTDALADPSALPAGLSLLQGQYGILMEALLEFNRFNLAGNRTAALQSVARFVTQSPTESLELIVWNEVGQTADALCGGEYRELAETGIAAQPPYPPHGPRLNGTVRSGPKSNPASRYVETANGKYYAHNCDLGLGSKVNFVLARSPLPGYDPEAVDVQVEPPTPPPSGPVSTPAP